MNLLKTAHHWKLALLGAILVTVAAAALASSPALAKKPPKEEPAHEAATYRVTVSGDLEGGPKDTPFTAPGSGEGLAVRGMVLDLGFFQDQLVLAGGSTCFGSGAGVDNDIFTGDLDIHEDRKNPGAQVIHFFFPALGTDGTTQVNYLLDMSGVITTSDNWLPAPNTSNTVTGGDWEISHANRSGKKVSCTGNGALNFTITVTGPSS